MRSLLLALVVGSLAYAADEKKDPPVIAHITLTGDLGEAPVGESLLGGEAGENLRQVLERVRKAKDDPKVKALILEMRDVQLGLFGFGKVGEVRTAIADFQKSGKKVYGYVEEIYGLDYFIACACDQIIIPEGGGFGFTGLHIEMSFYKNLFDKLHVKGDFLTMGEAKGAVEPYTRTEMSPENKKQYNLVLDDLYETSVIKTMLTSRKNQKWDAPRVRAIIDEAPYTAKKALQLGLVDRIGYLDAVEAQAKADLKLPEVKLARDYLKPKASDADALSLLLKSMTPSKRKSNKKTKIAILYAVGSIESGKGGGSLFGGSSIGSTTFVEAVREAESDPTVVAIVLRVDSPGGSALASDIMWNELKRCKKPVIASMGDVAASGGYYITTAAKKVFAEPGTLTGSIGVLGGKIVYGGLMDFVGIKTETLTRGKNAGMDSANAVFSPTEKKAITETMKEVYDQFLDKTLAGRTANGVKMTRDDLLKLAGGRIWTGNQAKQFGLVDALGTLEDAIAEAKAQAKLPKDADVEYLMLPEAGNPLDGLLSGKLGLHVEGASELQALLKTAPEMRYHLRHMESLLRMRRDRVWMMLPESVKVK